jgi:hypothetical protein
MERIRASSREVVNKNKTISFPAIKNRPRNLRKASKYAISLK